MMIIPHLLLPLVNTHANTKLNTNIEQMNKMIKETIEEFSTSQRQFITQVKLDLEEKEDLLEKFNELLKEHNQNSFLHHAKQAGTISVMIKKLTEMDEENLNENMTGEIIQETKTI